MSLLVQAKTGQAWGVAEPGCGQRRIQLPAVYSSSRSTELGLCGLQQRLGLEVRRGARGGEEVFGGSGPCE